ncbi:hypothetical protein COV82_02350 [Candidatus Peregrinibacteria bacterium CG11_big_fil_rev_8_21_14_0_20_46_8]|nr:MAG: hypothetical protein COV82_02350 [Candidatus Peregrinibacteria bacterium CG11_big_fil_rev_8_21_14_0_20_46_8]
MLKIVNHQKINDGALYKLCKAYGAQALEARRKFAGLLPEVARRKLFEKRKFHSIYEFAAKLAGMSRDQVDLILRLERKFQEMPGLYAALVNGEVSHNKLVRVAAIATPENDEELARAVRRLSKASLDVFVKDMKIVQQEKVSHEHSGNEIQNVGTVQNFEIQDALFKPKNEQNSLYGQSTASDAAAADNSRTNAKAASAADLKLLTALSPELKEKLHELLNKGFDLNETLLQLLAERDEKIQQTKQKIAIEQNEKEEIKKNIGKRASRHIPAAIRKIIHAEFGTICAISGCIKPSENLHHTDRFSVSQSHNPYFIAPLCKAHHDIAHKMDERYAMHAQTA